MKYNWYLMILLLLSTFIDKANIELYSDVTSNEFEHINELNNRMTSDSEELLDNTSILKTMIFRSDLKILNLVFLKEFSDFTSIRINYVYEYLICNSYNNVYDFQQHNTNYRI